jgi:hypothetical protein
MNERNQIALAVVIDQKLNKTNHQLAVRQGEASAASYVPHLSIAQVKALADSMGKRDRLLIPTIFDGCLWCSEALAATPGDVLDEVGGFRSQGSERKGR